MLEFSPALRNSELFRYEGLEKWHENLTRRGQDCEDSTVPSMSSCGRPTVGAGEIAEAAHFFRFPYDDNQLVTKVE